MLNLFQHPSFIFRQAVRWTLKQVQGDRLVGSDCAVGHVNFILPPFFHSSEQGVELVFFPITKILSSNLISPSYLSPRGTVPNNLISTASLVRVAFSIMKD